MKVVMDASRFEIRCRTSKDLDLAGATLVEAIPVAGLPAAIAGSFLAKTLDLDHVCGFTSDAFPPVGVVWNGKPRLPVRVYAREDPGVAVAVAEFTPQPALFRPLARALLEWARDQGVARVLSPDGLWASAPDYDPESPRVAGAATTDALRESLRKADVRVLDRAMVSGVSGMLLTEALEDFDVASLLVEVSQEEAGRVHDARAAAVLVDALKRVDAALDFEVGPLFEEAQRIEEMVKGLRSEGARAALEEDVAAAYR